MQGINDHVDSLYFCLKKQSHTEILAQAAILHFIPFSVAQPHGPLERREKRVEKHGRRIIHVAVNLHIC